MADQPQPLWKAVLAAFLEFLGALAASKRADKAASAAQERMADAEATGPRTADDVDQRLRRHDF